MFIASLFDSVFNVYISTEIFQVIIEMAQQAVP